MFYDLLRRLFRRNEPAVPSTLSRTQAIAIARAATKHDPQHQDLSLATVEPRGGTLIWTVSAGVIGSVLQVEIDDATGDVIDVRRVGGR